MSPNEVTGDILSDKGDDEFWCALESIIDDYIGHRDSGTISDWKKKHFKDLYPDTCTPGQMIGDAISSVHRSLILHMMECHECGRLWIQKENSVNGYFAYSPDDEPENRMKVLGLNKPKPAEQDADDQLPARPESKAERTFKHQPRSRSALSAGSDIAWTLSQKK